MRKISNFQKLKNLVGDDLGGVYNNLLRPLKPLISDFICLQLIAYVQHGVPIRFHGDVTTFCYARDMALLYDGSLDAVNTDKQIRKLIPVTFLQAFRDYLPEEDFKETIQPHINPFKPIKV